MGNAGDVEAVGEGISEMRIHYGAGYRVYYKRTGNTIMMILCGETSRHRLKTSSEPKKSQRSSEGKKNGESFKV